MQYVIVSQFLDSSYSPVAATFVLMTFVDVTLMENHLHSEEQVERTVLGSLGLESKKKV